MSQPRQRTGVPGGIRLGRVRGVPVIVSPSWLLIVVLLAAVYGPLVHDAVPGVSATAAYGAAVGFAILFGLCVLAHELGHTLVSTALGHPVKRVVLFFLGGVSEIDEEPERARDEFVIAAAGPLVSVVIAVVAWFAGRALGASTLPGVLLELLGYSNGLLAVFNLLPGLPLDCGRLLRAAVRACGAGPLTATRSAAWTGRVLAVLIAISGLVVDRSAAGISAGLLSVALGVYLWLASTQQLKAAELAARLPALSINSLLRPGLLVTPDVSIDEALRRVWFHSARGLVVVDAASRPEAIVDEGRLAAIPPERRPWTRVAEVARRLEPGLVLSLDLDSAALLRRMQDTPAHEYLVVARDGSPAGIIAATDFAQQLRALT